jgi:hypothetical protein
VLVLSAVRVAAQLASSLSPSAGTPASAARPGARFDMSTPANQRKLDIVEDLALLAEKSGMTLIELALASAINMVSLVARRLT